MQWEEEDCRERMIFACTATAAAYTLRLVGMHSNRNRVNCRRAAPSAPTSSNKHYCKTVAFFNLGLRGPQGSPIQKKSRKNQTETGLQDHCLPICFSNRFSLVSCPFRPLCVCGMPGPCHHHAPSPSRLPAACTAARPCPQSSAGGGSVANLEPDFDWR